MGSFLTDLFGGETNIWTILLALIIIIVLIFFVVWLLKLIFRASVTIAGGRKRRLAMVDSLAIDNKRNIILIRRDNVEHLIMVSNTGELLIEGSIPLHDANSEIKAPASPPVEPTSATLAAGEQNANVVAKAQNTSNINHSANRLGLSRLLRKNEPAKPAPIPASIQSSQPQKNTAPLVPIALASASAASIVSNALEADTSADQTTKTAPIFGNNTNNPLRTTGILKPISELSEVTRDASSAPINAKNNNEINVPVENVPVENSPVENSPIENSPLEESSVEIDMDATEENLNNTAPEETAASKETSEANSAEAPTTSPLGTSDQEKTEEVTSDEEDNSKAITTDSAKNKVQQIDTKAMESIEEGTSSGNDGAKSSKKASDSESRTSDNGSAKGAKADEKTS